MAEGRFEAVGSTMPFLAMEERQRAFWRERRVFERSVEERPAERLYTFYEGPPTANGAPGVHHVISRVYKDLFPRYKTMRGYRVPRKAGWDTHGLPVELEVERELGLSTKAEIEAFGIAEFNQRCRESVMRYVEQWRDLTDRIAFWIDLDDPYVTFERNYVETAWWIFKSLWDGGLIYEARRVTPHCPRCETSLSSHELSLGYREDTPDPSITVKFRLLPEWLPAELSDFQGETSLVAWTTTPWTLPGNTALAVASEETYAVVEAHNATTGAAERLILAQARLGGGEAGLEGAAVLRTLPGSALAGLRYEGLYEPAEWGERVLRFQKGRLNDWDAAAGAVERRVLPAGFVSMEEGTGIVHIAPSFGEDDYALGREQDLFFLQPVDLRGRFRGGPFGGRFVKDADAAIVEDLTARGLLLQRGTIRHTYPFCWRCDTPLLYYAKPSWYIATTEVAESLRRGNRELMHWYPAHVRDGRYGDWLANNVDWAISRERFWGTPLPFWRCADCAATTAVGSFGELAERSGGGAEIEDPHRPHVDEVTMACGGLWRHDAACAGGRGRLVRLGGDALRAVALSVRARGDVQAALPGRFHLRGGGPDAGLVLLAARRGGAAASGGAGTGPNLVPARDLAGAHPGRGRREDEQVQGERRGPLDGAGRARGRRAALVPVHSLADGQPAALQQRSGGGGAAPFPADAVGTPTPSSSPTPTSTASTPGRPGGTGRVGRLGAGALQGLNRRRHGGTGGV